MIVGNGVRLTGNPSRFLGAPLVHSETRANWNKSGALRNIFSNPDMSKLDGLPSGMRHPQVWLLPQQAGGLASRYEVEGVSVLVVNLAGGVNADATLDGEGGFTSADLTLLGFLTAAVAGVCGTQATVDAVGSALAGLVGSGDLVSDITSVLNAVAALQGVAGIDADAVATLGAVAALQGSGNLNPVLVGAIAALGALAGSGAVETAVLNAITQGVAAIAGGGDIPPAVLSGLGLVLAEPSGSGSLGGLAVAKGSMGALISLDAGTELSPASVAASVKTALLGAELDGFTIEDIIKLTSAAILGKSSGGAANPVFRSLDDAEVRVSGEVDSFGNRVESVLSP